MFKFIAEWLATMSAAFFVAPFIEGPWWLAILGVACIVMAIQLFKKGEENGE